MYSPCLMVYGPSMASERPMRRPQTEVLERKEIEAILERAEVIYLGIRDEEAPYVLPVNFGFEGDTLFVHCGPKGAKIDLILQDPRVGFSAHADLQIIAGDTACDFSARASSVVGRGRARIVQDEQEKVRGLDAIMRHYGATRPTYRPESLARTCVLAVDIEALRARRIG